MIGVLVADEPFAFDDLIRVGAVLLFLAWPALKAALNARKEGAEGGAGKSAAGQPDPRREAKQQQREGSEAWERLLRGEAPEPEVELSEPVLLEKPAPAPRVKEARPVVERKALASERAAPAAGPGKASPMSGPPERRTDSLPATVFEERGAPLTGVGGSPGAASGALESMGRGKVGAGPAGASGSLRARMAAQGPGSEIASPLRRHSTRGRVNWRRAVVLGEVLSLPLALRRDASWHGRP